MLVPGVAFRMASPTERRISTWRLRPSTVWLRANIAAGQCVTLRSGKQKISGGIFGISIHWLQIQRCTESGFFVTPAAENTTTQGQNLTKKNQPLGVIPLKIKNSRKHANTFHSCVVLQIACYVLSVSDMLFIANKQGLYFQD